MRSPLVGILVTPIWRGLGNPRCLTAWDVLGGSAQPLYRMYRLSNPGRSCDVCSN